MTEIYFLIAWWIIGFVGLLWVTAKHQDIDLVDMLVMAMVGVGGIIVVVITFIAMNSNKVVIKQRKNKK